MNDWQLIDTAPRDGTLIILKCESKPEYGEHLLYWDKIDERWAGRLPGFMGWLLVWWDVQLPQPTHWRLIDIGAVPRPGTSGEEED